MIRSLPSKAGAATIIHLEMTDAELKDLKGWIAALPEPRPDVEQAVRMIVNRRVREFQPMLVRPSR